MSTQSDYEAAKAAVKKAQDTAATTQASVDAAANKVHTIQSLHNDINDDTVKLKNIKDQLTLNQKVLSYDQQAYINYKNQIYANGNTPTFSQLNHLSQLDATVQTVQALIKSNTNLQIKIQKDKEEKQTKLDTLVPPKTTKVTAVVKTTKKNTVSAAGGTSGSGDASTQTTGFSKDYKYNAPMISGSYFNLDSIQAKELQANGFYVDAGNYSDARQAWSGQGGRGTIQMDKYFLANYDTSINAKDTLGQFDPQMYGFKFLYNPTTVGMAWGAMASMSPDFEAAGQDKFNPIMSGLASSTVAVDLLINRIEDMNVLSTTGFKGSATPVARTDREVERALAQLGNDKSVQNAYHTNISSNELAEIYKRGTMYDLEYLFKTINGPNAVFLSSLNGYTADKGWIRPQVVELHLGTSLRYRGRITDLSVNHVVFDARMVPVLSKIYITFARFPDFTIPPAGGATH